jgi:hypothetical protein
MAAMKAIAVAAVFFAMTAGPVAGADPDSTMPSGPEDPLCATMSWAPQCAGSPYAPLTAPPIPAPPPPPAPPALPAGPLDPQCMQMPADAACTGSPYVPQPPPPPPPMEPHMPMEPPMGGGMAEMPGMPGHI